MPTTHSKPPLRLFRFNVLFLYTLIAMSSFAADAAFNKAAAADSATPTVGLEEIVVTATRREENINRVPISVTAFSEEMIDQKGIKDFNDVVRFTPGVSIDTTGTNAISIRGISSSGGAGTTGIYIDDTPIQMRALGFNPDDALPKTFDLDRIEVLRGPQGTLFGAGSEGGTVRYIMTQPSATKESTYARAELSFTRGGDPSYEAGVAHGGPLIDGKLGYRASFWYRYDGGWIDRIDAATGAVLDHNSNHANTVAARLAMVYQPIDALQITPSIIFQNSRKHDLGTFWPAYSDVGGGHFRNGTPERIGIPDKYFLPALKIEADFGPVKLVSNTSYYQRDEQDSYQGTAYDLAYYQAQSWLIGTCGPASTTPAPPCSWYPLLDATGIHMPPGFAGYSTPNTILNQQKSYTQEIRLQSNEPASAWNWTAGVFWSLAREQSIEQLYDPQINQLFNALFGSDAFSYFGVSSYNCNNYPGSTPQNFPNCDVYYNRNTSHDRQLAGFGEVSFNVTDRLKVTAGGRYAKMSFDLSHYADGFENYGPGSRTGEYHENAFTPKLGAAFQYDEKNLYYATYAKGFRPGGVNPPLIPVCSPGLVQDGYLNGQSPLTYKSDKTQSFEVGTKNNFADRIRIATSAYYIRWTDIQQNVYVAGQCGLQFTDNLGTAVAWGGDLQAEMLLGAGFSLDASVGYTSARYSKDSPKAKLASRGDAISGNAAINYAPGTNAPWNVSIGPQYSFKALGYDAFARLDWEFASRNPWRAAVQDPTTNQYNANSYGLPSTKFASLRTGVTFGSWSVAAFVDNLFDSRVTTNYALVQSDTNNPSFDRLVPTSVQQNAFTFRPRTIGITATFRN